jgi:hypothetical protein
MEASFFSDLNILPKTTELKDPLANLYKYWIEIRDFVFEHCPKAVEEWHVSVKKYG